MLKNSRRILSLVLALFMVAGLVVIGNADTATYSISAVSAPTVADKTAYFQGQTTTVNFDTIKVGSTFEVSFDVYLDSDAFESISTAQLTYTWDDAVIAPVTTGSYNGKNFITHSADRGYTASDIWAESGSDYHTVALNGTKVPLGSSDYVCRITIPFKFVVGADDFYKAVKKDSDSALITLELNYEEIGDGLNSCFLKGTNSKFPDFDFENAATLTPIKIEYVGNMVTYDVAGGTCDHMSDFADKPVITGQDITVADGTDLQKDVDGKHYIFDFWTTDPTAATPVPYTPGKMPEGGVKLTAIYALDQDQDDEPDTNEFKVTYTLRDGDEGTLKTVGAETGHGKFFAEGDDLCINIKKPGAALGINAVAGVTLPEKWKLVGYYYKDTLYKTAAELAAVTISEAATIEVRTMPDKNDNNIDDRDNVAIDFYPNGTDLDNIPATLKPIDNIDKVPDGTPYEIYSTPDKTGTTPIKGTVGEDKHPKDGNGDDPTVVAVPVVSPVVDDKPFDKWDITYEDTDGDGKPDTIIAVPAYKTSQPIQVPGVVDPDPDPDDPDPDPTPVIVDMPLDGYIIFKGADGVEVAPRIPVSDTNLTEIDGQLTQVITPPAVGSHASLPARDANGNAFYGWTQDGPKTIIENSVSNRVVIYTAYYTKQVSLTVIDQGPTKEDTDDDAPVPGYDGKKVPADATYEVKGPNGEDGTKKPVPTDGTGVKLPADEDMPDRNNNGDVFKGDWTPTEETNPDGSKNYVFTPEYVTPTDEDIDIKGDPTDDLDGKGLSILMGEWAADNKVSDYFLMRVCDAPAVPSDAGRISVAVNRSNGFEPSKFEKFKFYKNGTDDIKVSYVDTFKDPETGLTYGRFKLEVTTVKSSILDLVVNYKNTTKTASHTVVTVGDADKNGFVNAQDVTVLLQCINHASNFPTMPDKGAAGEYYYELMNVDESKFINAQDVTIVLQMVNNAITSN